MFCLKDFGNSGKKVNNPLVNILAKNPDFFPTYQILEPLFLPCFVSFLRKICNRHYQRHHFHLRFCGVLSRGDDFLSKSC